LNVSHRKFVKHFDNFKKKYDQYIDTSEFDLSEVGKYKIPLFKATLKKYDFAHGLNAILIGDHALKYEDWQVVDPQMNFMFERGKPNLPNSILVISMLVQVTSPEKNNSLFLKDFALVRFVFDYFGKAYADFYYPKLIIERKYAKKIQPQINPNLMKICCFMLTN